MKTPSPLITLAAALPIAPLTTWGWGDDAWSPERDARIGPVMSGEECDWFVRSVASDGGNTGCEGEADPATHAGALIEEFGAANRWTARFSQR
jgi:hypothetical protein